MANCNCFGDTPLHIAAKGGDVEMVRKLLKSKQYSVDIMNDSKETPLHFACINGHLDIVSVLVNDFNADMDAKSISGLSPLLLAASNNHVQIVIMLLLIAMYGKKYHKNFRGPSSYSICTIEPSETKIVENMLTKYVDDSKAKEETASLLLTEFGDIFERAENVNFFPLFLAVSLGLEDFLGTMVRDYGTDISLKGFGGLSALHCACFRGHVHLVSTLISVYKLDHRSVSDECYSIMHYAAMGGSVEMVSLLATEFDMDPYNRLCILFIEGDCSPLALAAMNGHTELVEALIQKYNCKDSASVRRVYPSTLLHCACRCGNVGLIRKLITDYQLDLDATDRMGFTPLHTASFYGQTEAVVYLVTEFKVNINAHLHNMPTPLCIAGWNGFISTVRALIELLHSDPQIKDSNNMSLVHYGCFSGSIALVNYVISEYGLDPSAKDDDGDTPLHIAASQGNLETVEHLITVLNVNDINETNSRGLTPLCFVVKNGWRDLMKMLIRQYNCDPHVKDNNNKTLLHHACSSYDDCKELVDDLITEYGLDPSAKDDDGDTPLHIAASQGNFETAKRLVTKFNVNASEVFAKNITPLCQAASMGQRDRVKMLITLFDCDPHVKDSNNRTLLHHACSSYDDCKELVDDLITEYGLDPSAKDDDGDTPLHIAASQGNLETVKHLITVLNVNDVNEANSGGLIPLCFVVRNGWRDIMKMLITQYNCDSHVKDNNNKTLLHHACSSYNECKELVNDLITEYGLDPSAKDDDGNTPLHIAASRGNCETAKHLVTKFNVNASEIFAKSITPLCQAASSGQRDRVKMLITLFACDPHVKDSDNRTLLHHACSSYNDCKELVDDLITEYGLDPSAKDNDGNTPLHIAASQRNYKTAKHLVTKFNVNASEVFAKNICKAASMGQRDRVKMLITLFDGDPHVKDSKNRTLLHYACSSYSHCKELVDDLITEYGLDPSAKDDDGVTPLHIAASRRNLETVKHLITVLNVKNVNEANSGGLTPLCFVVRNGWRDLMKMSIRQYNCDPHVKDNNNKTLLHHACSSYDDCKELVDDLITEYGLDPSAKDDYGNTPLHIAASRGNCETAKHLVTKFNVNTSEVFAKSITPLCQAASMGQRNQVKMLITLFAFDPHVKDSDNRTLLHHACSSYDDCKELVDDLITEYGLDPSAKDDNGNTPLYIAASQGNFETAKHLVTKFNVNASEVFAKSITPLCQAASMGQRDRVKMLITLFDCDPHVKDSNNRTLLHHACSSYDDCKELVDDLITEYGLDPSAKDDDGNTPLHIAASRGNCETAKHLVTKFNVNTSEVFAKSITPLCQAASMGQRDRVKMLITLFDCDPHVKDSNNRTLLHHACSSYNDCKELVDDLITEYGLDPSAKDDDGDTPLHIAASRRNLETVKHLITVLNVNDVNEANSDVLMCFVVRNGWRDIMKMLITQYNCDPRFKDSDNRTLLHHACSSYDDCKELVNDLITEYGLDPSAKDDYGNTPLHIAASQGNCETAKHLVTKFNVNASEVFAKSITPLCQAASSGQRDRVKMLITLFDCDPHVKDSDNRTLLHHACSSYNNCQKLIDDLITEYGLDPSAKDDDGNTPLHIAASRGNFETAKHLVMKFNVNASEVFAKNITPLCQAASSGQRDRVKMLITLFACDPHVKDSDNRTLLHHACSSYSNCKELIDDLITEYGLDPSDKDKYGNAPLHIAALEGNLVSVKYLVIGCKVPVDTANLEGHIPLLLAAMNGHMDIVKIFIKQFDFLLRAKCSKGGDLLFHACHSNNRNLVKYLITEHGFDPSAKDDDGDTPLHIAASQGNLKTVRYLLAKCDVNANEVNSYGSTPLCLAAKKGKWDMVKILITQFKCDPHTKDNENKTLLHHACLAGHAGIVRDLLLEYQLSSSAKDSNGVTPLHAAAEKSHDQIVEFILVQDKSLSANLEIRDGEGQTILHTVCRTGNISLLCTLVQKYEFSVLAEDSNRNTPLHVAARSNKFGCVHQLLQQYNAPLNVKNVFGRTPSDIASGKTRERLLKFDYYKQMSDTQSLYKDLYRQAKAAIGNHSTVTRIFVVGHPQAGKSTLIETLKKESLFKSVFYSVTGPANVLPHTAGIVPSIFDSTVCGRLLLYDFAGNPEYYSSHAAILETLSDSDSVNIFLVVCNLQVEDEDTLIRRYGYWLSFISHINQASPSVVVLPIGSHADLVDEQEVRERLSHINANSQDFHSKFTNVDIHDCIDLDCRKPNSIGDIKKLVSAVSSSVSDPHVQASPKLQTVTLLGILLKEFAKVPACKFQTLLSKIKDMKIPLPHHPSLIYELAMELQDLGLIMVIKNAPDDFCIIINISSLTIEVHTELFSRMARRNFSRYIDELTLNAGVIPESLLSLVLPGYITKECLIKLQYCQEIENVRVEDDYSLAKTDSPDGEPSLLFFPSLCEVKLENIPLSVDKEYRYALGWYAKCSREGFDYFPTRFLHVLIIRLSQSFAKEQCLPLGSTSSLAKCSPHNVLDKVCAYNPRCHMWTTGLHWLMKNAEAEVFVDMPNNTDNKELVVVVRTKKCRAECGNVLLKVIQKINEAKVEFCHSIRPSIYLLDSVKLRDEPFTNARYMPRYTLSDVKSGCKIVHSVDGHSSIPLDDLTSHTKWTMSYWYLFFPMDTDDIENAIEEVAIHWNRLGMNLGISHATLEEINHDYPETKKKRKAMIQVWMTQTTQMPTWSSLVQALHSPSVRFHQIAEKISKKYNVPIQDKILDDSNSTVRPDLDFLQSFASIVGSRWQCLASPLLSLAPEDIASIKRETRGAEPTIQALAVLQKWAASETATYGQLRENLCELSVFQL